MNDYRYTQIEELDKQIEETKTLLDDPAMADMARDEIAQLEASKKELEESIAASNTKEEDNYDERNIMLEMSGAAGGDEAKIWAEELMRMYTRAAQKKGFHVEQLE
jgi:peptide chain release factor 1